MDNGSGIRVMDFWNMEQVHCGTYSTSGLYRHDYIDYADLSCISAIYIFFDQKKFNLKYANPTTLKIGEWLSRNADYTWRYIPPSTDNFIINTFYNYEFIWMNERNDTIYAGIYYTEDNENSPQFVYSFEGVNFTAQTDTQLISTKIVPSIIGNCNTSSVNQHLHVCPGMVPPIIQTPQTSVSYYSRDNITLVCSYLSYYPVIDVRWNFDTSENGVRIILTNDTDHTKYSGSSTKLPSLTIHTADLSDQGNYTCSMKNRFGWAEGSAIQIKMLTETRLCQCPCSPVKNGSNYTVDELHVLLLSSLKKLEKELKVDKKLLSSYVSKHVSASDERLSSRSLGIGGIVCLCLMAAAILGMDLMSIKRHTATAKGICIGRP
ncbi:unnamed protein product [Mytilus coruscus]|uniref:Ig-like domain-containing protein n=1 Tax=Mytilus coruscus TaxID=42192 RepID=A0A6J8AVU7_MYTCO|nr:unnamed protein product [Mytilus coruscus]